MGQGARQWLATEDADEKVSEGLDDRPGRLVESACPDIEVIANRGEDDVLAGDPRGDSEGGPGYTIRDELNQRPYLRGTVGMALDWADTGGSHLQRVPPILMAPGGLCAQAPGAAGCP